MQNDIAWFDIAVDDTLLVSVIKCDGDLVKEPRNLIGWDTFFSLVKVTQVRRQRRTLQVFHNDKWMTINSIEIEYLNDIRMAQACHHFRLAVKSFNKQRFFFYITMQ